MGKPSTRNQSKSKVNAINDITSKTTSSNKRDRSPTSSPEQNKRPSKTATMSSTSITIDDFRQLLQEQSDNIVSSLRSEMKTLSDEIKADFESKITQLNTRIDDNQVHMQSQINELKSSVTQCVEQANGVDDDLQRISRLNELKISGIIHKNDENLNEIFKKIANLVQFDLSDSHNMPTLERIFKRNHTTNTNAPTQIILVKFIANHIRNDFYSRYLNKIAAKKPIMSQNIDLPEGIRIIIGENLTAKNMNIFIESSKLKKLGKLAQVFTQEGLVHIKANRNAKATIIKSKTQLELFVLANPSANIQIEKPLNATSSTQAPNTATSNITVNMNTDEALNVNMAMQQQQ